MLIKVCGLKIQQNLDAVIKTGIGMVGFNYYPQSKRYLENTLQGGDPKVKRVGVFVNADLETIKKLVSRDNLSAAQLHGDESVEVCKAVQTFTKVIKVFRVDEDFDFSQVVAFEFCDLFLFDTYTSDYGGSGKAFDWSTLASYQGNTPFLLSGGIGPHSVEALKEFKHSKYIGIDINSRFETSPGVKDVELIQTFVNELNRTTNK